MEAPSATGMRRVDVVAFDHSELRAERAASEMVLVDEGAEDQRGQRAEVGRRGVVTEMPLAFYDEALVAEPVTQFHGPLASAGPGQPEAQFVNGEPQVLDL